MDTYDPNVAPDPREWLAMDEGMRSVVVQDHHERASFGQEDPRLHVLLHTVVETQLAENHAPSVGALRRLLDDGLSRHDAIHAIAAVVSKHLFGAVNGAIRNPADLQAGLQADLENLTAASWRAEFGTDRPPNRAERRASRQRAPHTHHRRR